MTERPYAWVAFYSELADKLLPYRDDHAALVQKIYQLYENTGIKMPKMEVNGELF